MPYYKSDNDDHVEDWFYDPMEPAEDGQLTQEGQRELMSELYEEDEFPDGEFVESIHSKYPGWYLVRITGFISSTFTQMKPWLDENVKFGQFKKVGWDSGCSSSVGVVFQSPKDAMMFKLRWR
jgi:hypothetical protein